jgi:hypothetical protein
MRWPMTDRIDDDSWVMGVMEPILLLLLIARAGELALAGLFPELRGPHRCLSVTWTGLTRGARSCVP